MEYKYSENSDEISGFGGEYEEACRKMVITGLKWLDKNKGSNPTFDQFENIFGITANENEDMQALQEQMLSEVPDCSGAMMHASTNHVLYAYKNGWDNYLKEMEKRNS